MKGVIGVELMGGLDFDSIADHASTCFCQRPFRAVLELDIWLLLVMGHPDSTMKGNNNYGLPSR
jgi:hypothetical protein